MEIFDDEYAEGDELGAHRYRQFGELEVHDDLIEAQKNGELVVFAGAGVSAGPPSCLPTFEGLICELEEWSGEARKRETIRANGEEFETLERFEQYLGRLEDQRNVEFRPRVREVIGREDSEPTELHRHLLELFGSPEETKIVTTNFDRHFSRVAGEDIDEYKAPALPRGDDFSGIAHLHGNLSQQNRRLVLSDKDFSEAYLTQGWARRFLQQLFSEYVVLFVGYGHADDVMRYLARGIPPDRDKGRFAFEIQGDHSVNWEHYGVEVSRFPQAEGEDLYAELPRGIQEWVDRTTRRLPSEHEEEIESILQNEPESLSRSERDELDAVLTEQDGQIQFFTDHANSVEWVEWVLREGYLEPLFEPGPVEDRHEHLAFWLAGRITSAPDRLLAHLTGKHRRWNPVLTNEVVASLHSVWKEELDSGTIAKWMRVVLQNVQKSPSSHLSSMLRSCEFPEDRDLAVLLFRYLTRPAVNWRISAPFLPEEHPSTTSIEVRFSGGGQPPSTTFVREAWEEFFYPNLEHMAPEVESILSERLRGFHSAYLEYRTDAVLDPLTRQWERIRFDDEERVTNERYVLPACGKELLEWLLQNMPERADSVIDRWAHSSVPVLEVLATYGVDSDSRKGADEKINWVLEREWLLLRRGKGEPGRVVIGAFSESSAEVRDALLERIQERIQQFDAEERTGRLRSTRRLLAHLGREAPHDEEVHALLEDFDETHPGLQEQSVASEMPAEEQDQVLDRALDPETDLDKIRNLFAGETEPWTRQELEHELEGVLHREPGWCIQVGRQLAERGAWEDPAWPFLFRVYRRIDLGVDEWRELLDLCRTNVPLHERYGEEILLTAIHAVGHPDRSFPEALLGEVVALVDCLWSHPEYAGYDGEKSRRDWFRYHTHTKTVRFYYRIFVERPDQDIIPEPFRARVGEMLEAGSGPVPSITAFALARRAAALFYLDRDWGREVLLPLFDWTENPEIATAAWTGFVSFTQRSQPLMQELRDDFKHTFGRMQERLDPDTRKELVQMVARICAWGVVDPTDGNWLRSFSENATSDERASWARTVCWIFSDKLSNEQVEHAWNEWIEGYLQQRCAGIPVPLQPSEGREVMRWVPHLGSHYPDGVDQVRDCDPTISGDGPTDFGLQIAENDLAVEYPDATRRFLEFLMGKRLIRSMDLRQILPVLAQQDVSETDLDSLFEGAIGIGAIDRAFKEEHLSE